MNVFNDISQCLTSVVGEVEQVPVFVLVLAGKQVAVVPFYVNMKLQLTSEDWSAVTVGTVTFT